MYTPEIRSSPARHLEEELAKLQLEYDTKNKELIDLDIANRRFSRESRQNELYEEMLSAQDTLSTCMAEARTIAIGEGVVLSGSVSGWQRQLNAIGDVPEKVNAAVQKAQAASEAYEEARAAFYAILENKKLRVSDDVFEYIRKRTGLIRELDTLTEKMVDLNVLAASLRTVTAPWDGYIAAVDIAEGDTLDGSKAVGSMTKEGTVPLLRAPLGETRRVFEPGTKVTVETAQGSEKTEVSETRVAADGTRYLWIALPERLLRPESSELRQMASDGRVSVSITYRAKNSTTLLVPSAVRNEGEGSDYVYLVEQNRGGFMSSAGLKVVKTKVTVIDRGDKYVSIADDLSYRQVADREDRALSDGMAVMEYVQ